MTRYMEGWYEPRVEVRWDPTLPDYRRRATIAEYATRFPHIRDFVETGTNNGDTPVSLYHHFDRLYTIEVGETIFRNNVEMFARYPNVLPLLGDSTDLLPEVLSMLAGAPAIFWLDGHFCGDARSVKDTPVQEELEIILGSGIRHIILIDDARLFGRDEAYPTIEWVRDIATTQDIQYEFSYVDDIMRIVPYAT